MSISLGSPSSPQGILPGTIFHEWRAHQRETVDWALEQFSEGKKYVTLDAPPGYGKSLTGVAIGKLLGYSTLYVCSSKQLQDQIADDFPDCAVLKGRNNYPCLRTNGNLSADMCSHVRGDPCDFRIDDKCPYRVAKEIAMQSPLAVVNYSLFLLEANHVGGLSGRHFIVMDEADKLDDAIVSHATLTVRSRFLQSINLSPPDCVRTIEDWIHWGRTTLPNIDDQLDSIEQEISEMAHLGLNVPEHTQQKARNLRTLVNKLRLFIVRATSEWILDDKEEGVWVFKPKWANELGDVMAMRHGERILAMSGTMPSPEFWAKDLGLPLDKVAFREVPSTFPPDRRPVIVMPVVKMTYSPSRDKREEKYAQLLEKVDELLDKYPEDKGVVHTVNGELCSYLVTHSRHRSRLITHDTKNRGDIADLFMESTKPLVLVSPSFSRGLDLKGDRSRFQCVLKIPYAGLGDKQTKARADDGDHGQAWYSGLAIRDVVQMSGRVMRSEDDWGVTYIMDARFGRFYYRNKNQFPTHFQEAVTWEEEWTKPD